MPAAVTFLIATRNAHKVGEIRGILGEKFQCLTLNDFPAAPKVIEDANSFAGNATKKAVELAQWISQSRNPKLDLESRSDNSNSENQLEAGLGSQTRNFFILADDSGLEVDALNGAPGVHSARFAALDSGRPDNSADADNNAKLLRLLKNVPAEKRTARFRCVLALTPVQLETRNSKLETCAASPVCFANELELQTKLFDGACEGRIDFSPRGQGGFGYDPLFIPDGFEQSFAELGEETKNKLSHRAQALKKLKSYLEGAASSAP